MNEWFEFIIVAVAVVAVVAWVRVVRKENEK